MIPGLIGPPFPVGATKGRLVAIASSESPTVPLVVGVCEVNVSGLTKVVGEEGKAVRVVHWVGDEIFNYGGAGGKIPESLEWPTGGQEVSETTKGLEDIGLEDKDEEGKGKEKQGVEENTGEEEIRELTTKGFFRSYAPKRSHQADQTTCRNRRSFPLCRSFWSSPILFHRRVFKPGPSTDLFTIHIDACSSLPTASISFPTPQPPPGICTPLSGDEEDEL